jgi:hypothetical protein
MRAYYFGNMYLSSIQQGIQADHCSGEMVVKYAPHIDTETKDWVCPDTDKYQQMYSYLKDHKTDILLNAGYSATLHEIFAGLSDAENPYPFAKFHESEEALDGALTCVGVVIPEAIYETASDVRNVSRMRGNTAARDKIADFNEFGEWMSEGAVPINYTFTKFQVWLINEINKYPLAK